MTGRVSQSEIRNLFQEWIIDHKRADEVIEEMETMRAEKRAARTDTEARGICIIAPSHSGKTHTVRKAYCDKFLIPECRKSGEYADEVTDDEILLTQQKVLYVALEGKPHLGATVGAFLEALGDPKPYTGSPNARLQKARKQMQEGKFELVVVDNVDVLGKVTDARTTGEASQTQDVLKVMMNKGMPMVFIGSPTVGLTVLDELQLENRIINFDYSPLKWSDHDQKLLFFEYLGTLDIYMCDRGIFDEASNLVDSNIAKQLHNACNGQLGVLSDMLCFAAKAASKKKLDKISNEILGETMTKWAPITRKLKLAAAAQ